MLVATYEDRTGTCAATGAAQLTGLLLMAMSLQRHCPGTRVVAWGPVGGDGGDPLWQTLEGMSHVCLGDSADLGVRGWDVKPTILLSHLRTDAEVVWIDSDIILRRDFRPRFSGLDSRAFGVTREYRGALWQGSVPRTRALGLSVGRSIPFTLNSAVLRVTREHVPLLSRWKECLASPAYRAEQAKSYDKRSAWFASDQDVLTGLLGSTDFAHVPLDILRPGKDIAHCWGYTGFSTTDRLRCASNLPTFVHAQGDKPWCVSGELMPEINPYRAVARAYRACLPGDMRWLDTTSAAGKICAALSFGSPALCGLPVVAARELLARIRYRGKFKGT